MFYYSNRNVNRVYQLKAVTNAVDQVLKAKIWVTSTVGGKVLAKKEFNVATRSGASWNSTTRKSEWNCRDIVWDMAVPNNYSLLLGLLASLAPHRSLVSADCLKPPDTDKRCPSPRVRMNRPVELRLRCPVSLLTSQQQSICRSANIPWYTILGSGHNHTQRIFPNLGVHE